MKFNRKVILILGLVFVICILFYCIYAFRFSIYNEYAIYKKDVRVCDQFMSHHYSNRIDCYIDVAKVTYNLSICEDICERVSEKYYCLQKVYSSRFENNIKSEFVFPSTEDLLEYKDRRNYEWAIANIYHANLCNNISNLLWQDDCNKIRAILVNPLNCANLNYQDNVVNCFYEYFQDSLSPKLIICENITDNETKASCYLAFSKSSYNLNSCNFTADKYTKSRCYSNIALFNQNVSLCDFITIDERADQCYSDIAMVKQDSSICDNIMDIVRRNNCYSRVK